MTGFRFMPAEYAEVERREHWRRGERLIEWMEESVRLRKEWMSFEYLPPPSGCVAAFESEVAYMERNPLSARGNLTLRGHEEIDGQAIINLWQGDIVLRRAHLGANHRETDAGRLIRGPHIHFPTSAFPNISGRGRSRAYAWEVDAMLPLMEVALLFANHVNIVGNPDIQGRMGDAPNEFQ